MLNTIIVNVLESMPKFSVNNTPKNIQIIAYTAPAASPQSHPLLSALFAESKPEIMTDITQVTVTNMGTLLSEKDVYLSKNAHAIKAMHVIEYAISVPINKAFSECFFSSVRDIPALESPFKLYPS